MRTPPTPVHEKTPMHPYSSPPQQDGTAPDRRTMLAGLAAFQSPSMRRSVTQLAVTARPTPRLLAFMYYSYYHISPWLSVALALPAAGFVVRLFIIQHDCGHGAYFRSRWANETRRLALQPDHLHALCPVAPPPFAASRGVEQPRQAAHRRRHLLRLPDADGIRGVVAAAAAAIPRGAASAGVPASAAAGVVHPGSPHPVRHAERLAEGTDRRLSDQPRHWRCSC